MCLILFSINPNAQTRLLLAANRDEFFQRPTRAAQFWEDEPNILAGRDLQGGGTWMGVTRSGRLAAITNIRDLDRHRPDALTRGELVADFLKRDQSAPQYLDNLTPRASHYNGFNLLLGDASGFYCYHSDDANWQALGSGVYGLSNGRLDSPWPKSIRGRSVLARLDGKDLEPLWRLMSDQTRPSDTDLPDTGIGLEWERTLSSIFIRSPEYGTRCTTLVRIGTSGNLTFSERGWDPGNEYEPRQFDFTISATGESSNS